MKDFFLKSFQEYKKQTKRFWNVSKKTDMSSLFRCQILKKNSFFLY